MEENKLLKTCSLFWDKVGFKYQKYFKTVFSNNYLPPPESDFQHKLKRLQWYLDLSHICMFTTLAGYILWVFAMEWITIEIEQLTWNGLD